ncbi:MAG TPA: methyltransferase domain-containing protein [Candidatus Limnocylindrales bacterium]
MDRLAGAEELLDGPLDDRAALVGNLRDLARFNRHLGGVDLSARAIQALAPGTAEVSILDVGTGGADIPLALIERGRAAARLVRVTGVDDRPEVLEAATLADPRVTATGELTLHVADGRSLPFADESFDVAHASLLTHHLEPDAARRTLAEMARVARLGVVVNDLVRCRRAFLGAWLLSRVATRNRLTRNDAPLSVRRAYSFAELTALMAAAGLQVERRFDGPFGHRIALTARRSGTR